MIICMYKNYTLIDIIKPVENSVEIRKIINNL